MKAAFRIGLGATLVSTALGAFVLAQAQTGPSWEVPSRVVGELAFAPIASVALSIVALAAYWGARRFQGIARTARLAFWVLLALNLIISLVIWVFDPGQWPQQNHLLSDFARILWIPIWIACGGAFWYWGR